jgi:hypothetical protein
MKELERFLSRPSGAVKANELIRKLQAEGAVVKTNHIGGRDDFKVKFVSLLPGSSNTVEQFMRKRFFRNLNYVYLPVVKVGNQLKHPIFP